VRAVVQRVLNASVSVNDTVIGKMEGGLLVYLGVAHNDSETDAEKLCDKITNLRIFNDKDEKMNLSILDLQKDFKQFGILAISQFTLLADARKGRRPSYTDAANPEKANPLYEHFVKSVKKQGIVCEKGEFGAHMTVTYTNDGPVTIVLDTADF